jgi:hypothetical protein
MLLVWSGFIKLLSVWQVVGMAFAVFSALALYFCCYGISAVYCLPTPLLAAGGLHKLKTMSCRQS